MQPIRSILISVLLVSSHAFTTISMPTHRSTTCASPLFYRNATDVYDDVAIKSRTDFKHRMRSIIKHQQRTSWRPDNMKTASNLHDFAKIIQEGRRTNRLVVVNFHATWCKKCHSLRPAFIKMAVKNPRIIYLDVPVTESNSNIHKGLGIETVPFCHIYHHERGLVEETKISRETLSEFASLVQKYDC